MTRSHSNAAALAIVALVLVACAGPSGEPAKGFLNREAERAYIPLSGTDYIFINGDAAAVALGDGVAVTNEHTAGLVDERLVIGTSRDYDLMFFHTDKKVFPLAIGAPRQGARVLAYGQFDGALRRAEGVVARLDAPVKPKCRTCAVQSAFTFEGNAGPGFSGGPVFDAASGKLIGIVFGYNDNPDGGRTIFAYDMARVNAELKRIEDKMPIDPD
jgi:hypothetical protein